VQEHKRQKTLENQQTFRTVSALGKMRTGTSWTATSHVTEKIVWNKYSHEMVYSVDQHFPNYAAWNTVHQTSTGVP
jgi:hypothetical protein